MDEKHLLARARRGEVAAFEELVRLYEKRVYAVALRSAGSPEDAADIVQEVFLRAWRSIESFRGDSGFSTWLFRITMNLCVDFARHKHAQPQTQPLEGEDDAERPRTSPDRIAARCIRLELHRDRRGAGDQRGNGQVAPVARAACAAHGFAAAGEPFAVYRV